MFTDPQQVDITPYKVLRENAITSQQPKVPEVTQSTDLATSILDKITEIKDNLYPSHLNIPPQKFGSGPHTPVRLKSPNLKASITAFENQEALENLLRKDTLTSVDHSKSRDASPNHVKSPGSPFYLPSPINSRIHTAIDTSPDARMEISNTFQDPPNHLPIINPRSNSNSPTPHIPQIGSNSSLPGALNKFSDTPNYLSPPRRDDYRNSKQHEQIYNFVTKGDPSVVTKENPVFIKDNFYQPRSPEIENKKSNVLDIQRESSLERSLNQTSNDSRNLTYGTSNLGGGPASEPRIEESGSNHRGAPQFGQHPAGNRNEGNREGRISPPTQQNSGNLNSQQQQQQNPQPTRLENRGNSKNNDEIVEPSTKPENYQKQQEQASEGRSPTGVRTQNSQDDRNRYEAPERQNSQKNQSPYNKDSQYNQNREYQHQNSNSNTSPNQRGQGNYRDQQAYDENGQGSRTSNQRYDNKETFEERTQQYNEGQNGGNQRQNSLKRLDGDDRDQRYRENQNYPQDQSYQSQKSDPYRQQGGLSSSRYNQDYDDDTFGPHADRDGRRQNNQNQSQQARQGNSSYQERQDSERQDQRSNPNERRGNNNYQQDDEYTQESDGRYGSQQGQQGQQGKSDGNGRSQQRGGQSGNQRYDEQRSYQNEQYGDSGERSNEQRGRRPQNEDNQPQNQRSDLPPSQNNNRNRDQNWNKEEPKNTRQQSREYSEKQDQYYESNRDQRDRSPQNNQGDNQNWQRQDSKNNRQQSREYSEQQEKYYEPSRDQRDKPQGRDQSPQNNQRDNQNWQREDLKNNRQQSREYSGNQEQYSESNDRNQRENLQGRAPQDNQTGNQNWQRSESMNNKNVRHQRGDYTDDQEQFDDRNQNVRDQPQGRNQPQQGTQGGNQNRQRQEFSNARTQSGEYYDNQDQYYESNRDQRDNSPGKSPSQRYNQSNQEENQNRQRPELNNPRSQSRNYNEEQDKYDDDYQNPREQAQGRTQSQQNTQGGNQNWQRQDSKGSKQQQPREYSEQQDQYYESGRDQRDKSPQNNKGDNRDWQREDSKNVRQQSREYSEQQNQYYEPNRDQRDKSQGRDQSPQNNQRDNQNWQRQDSKNNKQQSREYSEQQDQYSEPSRDYSQGKNQSQQDGNQNRQLNNARSQSRGDYVDNQDQFDGSNRNNYDYPQGRSQNQQQDSQGDNQNRQLNNARSQSKEYSNNQYDGSNRNVRDNSPGGRNQNQQESQGDNQNRQVNNQRSQSREYSDNQGQYDGSNRNTRDHSQGRNQEYNETRADEKEGSFKRQGTNDRRDGNERYSQNEIDDNNRGPSNQSQSQSQSQSQQRRGNQDSQYPQRDQQQRQEGSQPGSRTNFQDSPVPENQDQKRYYGINNDPRQEGSRTGKQAGGSRTRKESGDNHEQESNVSLNNNQNFSSNFRDAGEIKIASRQSLQENSKRRADAQSENLRQMEQIQQLEDLINENKLKSREEAGAKRRSFKEDSIQGDLNRRRDSLPEDDRSGGQSNKQGRAGSQQSGSRTDVSDRGLSRGHSGHGENIQERGRELRQRRSGSNQGDNANENQGGNQGGRNVRQGEGAPPKRISNFENVEKFQPHEHTLQSSAFESDPQYSTDRDNLSKQDLKHNNQAMDKRFSFGLIPQLSEGESQASSQQQQQQQQQQQGKKDARNQEQEEQTPERKNSGNRNEPQKRKSRSSNVSGPAESQEIVRKESQEGGFKEQKQKKTEYIEEHDDIAVPVDSKQSEFTFTKGETRSSQANLGTQRTNEMDSPPKVVHKDGIVFEKNVIVESLDEDPKQSRRQGNSSLSPPRRRQQSDAFGGGSQGGYITLENDRKTRTLPGSMKGIDEGVRTETSPFNPNQQRQRGGSGGEPQQAHSSMPSNVQFSRLSSPMNGMNFGNPQSMIHHQQNPSDFMGQPNPFNMGNMGNMGNLPANWGQMPMNFPVPNFPVPNFENTQQAADYQKSLLMIVNYYESHLNNMKNLVMQQNESWNREKQRSHMLEYRNNELVKKIQELDKFVKEQNAHYETAQKELKTRYEVVFDELTLLKKNFASKVSEESASAQVKNVAEGPGYQNLLYYEILSLRKDLDQQRQTMYDFRANTHHLEGQMKDLEKIYIEELKSNVNLSHKREQLQDALDKYKTNYIKMDTFNKIILDGYERTKKDLEELKSASLADIPQQEVEQAVKELNVIQTSPNPRGRGQGNFGINPDLEDREKKRREIYIRSISPVRYDNEGNAQEMLRNKMRAQESQVKELLQWNSNKSPTNPVSIVFTTQTQNPSQMPSAGVPVMYDPRVHQQQLQQQHQFQQHQQQQQQLQQRTLQIPNTSTTPAQLAHRKQSSIQGYPQNSSLKVIPPADQKGIRGNVTFPSYQKIEDNKEEIRMTDLTLVQLTQHRKIIENELFKMPSVTKSLDQKRKKASLEMELEGIDYQIEECKNKLRKYDVLTVKN